jgi:hypothetical protein
VDESPQNWQWEDAYTGCPQDFCNFSKFQALAMDSSPQIYATGDNNNNNNNNRSVNLDEQFKSVPVLEVIKVYKLCQN